MPARSRDRRSSDADAAADVRRADRRAFGAARREQHRPHGGERGSQAAGHIRSPGALRHGADRARRHPLRGQPLRRHARQHRLRQPGRGSSRTSTSRRKRACACPGQTATASRSDSPARPSRMSLNLNSDPPLSSVGIALLLFDPVDRRHDAELQGLNPTATTQVTGRSAEGGDRAAADRQRLGAGQPRRRADAGRRPADHAVDRRRRRRPADARPRGSSSASVFRTAPTSRSRGRSAATSSATRFSCSNTTRTTASAGSSPRTATAPSRSTSACSIGGDAPDSVHSRSVATARRVSAAQGSARRRRARCPPAAYIGQTGRRSRRAVRRPRGRGSCRRRTDRDSGRRAAVDGGCPRIDHAPVRPRPIPGRPGRRERRARRRASSLRPHSAAQRSAGGLPAGRQCRRRPARPAKSLGLDEGLLRRTMTNRFGASPPVGRAPEVARTLEQLYRDHGFLRATVAARCGRETRP